MNTDISKGVLSLGDVVKYGVILASVLLAFSSVKQEVALLNQKIDYLVKQSDSRMSMTLKQQETISSLKDRVLTLEQRVGQ